MAWSSASAYPLVRANKRGDMKPVLEPIEHLRGRREGQARLARAPDQREQAIVCQQCLDFGGPRPTRPERRRARSSQPRLPPLPSRPNTVTEMSDRPPPLFGGVAGCATGSARPHPDTSALREIRG